MTAPTWDRYGHLTPDAPEAQRDVWALYALVHARLCEALRELATRSAEPVFAAMLDEQARAAARLVEDLAEAAGEAGRERVSSDVAVARWDGALSEVLASGHVPSLIATGSATLGEVAHAPLRLLAEVAGPGAGALAGRVLVAEPHRPLVGLFEVVRPPEAEREQLRRLLRHLHGELSSVFAEWIQTFHTLGVDGESVGEEGRASVRRAAHALGLKVTRADLGVFGP